MDSLKKIAWSGSAVVLALVMALSLMAPQSAQAAGTITAPITGTVWNGNMGANTAPIGNLVITEGTGAEFANASTLILTLPAGAVTWSSAACAISGGTTGHTQTCAVGALNAAALTITFTDGATPSAAPVVMTLSGITMNNAAARAAGPMNVVATGTATPAIFAANTVVGVVNANQLVLGATFAGACVAGQMQPASFSADPLAQGGRLCASLADAAGATATMANVPITFTVSTGVVGTGTAKTTVAFTSDTGGPATTNYRGAGGVAGTDTAIATNTSLNLVGTVNLALTAPNGANASKIVVQAPTVLAVAPTITNTTPGYSSPTAQTNFSIQVTDSAGQGVNNEVVLISTDKGAVVQGFDATCTTAKALTGTTAAGPLTKGGDTKAGVIALTFCGNQLDTPGKATITVQNVTTSMANATTSISHAGRPSKIDVTATGNAISAKVSDAGGNAVADGTPVRFTMSNNAGAVSTNCTTTSNGAASAVVALIAATGTVIVSADWNESGAPASCNAGTPAAALGILAGAGPGSQQVAASVSVPGGSSSSGGGSTGGSGTLTSGSVPATGFGLIVFGGGTVQQLVTASAVGTSGALYATVGGIFVPYVPGTTIAAVNADFLAAFPGGNIPANTAFVGRK